VDNKDFINYNEAEETYTALAKMSNLPVTSVKRLLNCMKAYGEDRLMRGRGYRILGLVDIYPSTKSGEIVYKSKASAVLARSIQGNPTKPISHATPLQQLTDEEVLG
jgi:hypothetical protein